MSDGPERSGHLAPAHAGVLAAMNQAPLLRRTRANMLRPVDDTRDLVRTMVCERGMPPFHLLRHVFETATSFSQL